jgi:hypothetical protein
MRDISSGFSQGGKLAYEKPQLQRIGTLETITKHASTGYALDAGFTQGTPGNSLTFSD